MSLKVVGVVANDMLPILCVLSEDFLYIGFLFTPRIIVNHKSVLFEDSSLYPF